MMFGTPYEILEDAAERYGDSSAIKHIANGDVVTASLTVNYREFFENINRTARLIKRLLGKNDGAISFLLPNIPQAQGILWGGSAVAIVSPLNPLLNEVALASLLAESNTKVLFALGPNENSDIWQKALSLKDKVGCLEHVYAVGFKDESWPYFDEEVLEEEVLPLPREWRKSRNEVAAYFHTGGTTGSPKLAKLTHHNLTAAAFDVAKSFGSSDKDVVLNGLPLFHVGGSILLSLGSFVSRATMVLPTMLGFRSQTVVNNIWSIIAAHNVSILSAIPTSLVSFSGVGVGEHDISSLRLITCGGAPAPLPVLDDIHNMTGRDVHQMYGMTECAGMISFSDVSKLSVRGSVGRASDHTSLRIRGAKGRSDFLWIFECS